MPTFKPKNTRQIPKNIRDAATLDGTHEKQLDLFEHRRNSVIPGLESELTVLRRKKRTGDVVERSEARRQITELKTKIRVLIAEEKEYFLTNGPLVFKYFEDKKMIAQGEARTTVSNFFGKSPASSIKSSDSTVQRYLANMDDSYIIHGNYHASSESMTCATCRVGELIPVEHEGVLVCNKCGSCMPYLIENEKPSYKEPPKEISVYAYKRINHFREILAQFQAKETTQIPDNVLTDVREQIRRERLTVDQITNHKMKTMLKKLGHNKYYEHIPYIKDKIGIRPPVMSADLEETLCNLFMDIQAPYARYCPEDRVNFLNYYYTVYKLCELLDQTQFLPFFPMLKDRDKRIEQDEIWKKICGELDWEFIPTD